MSSAEIKEVCTRPRIARRVSQSELMLGFVQALDLPSIKSHRWRIQPCSAVTGDHLIEGLDWVVNDVAGRYVLYRSSITVDLTGLTCFCL